MQHGGPSTSTHEPSSSQPTSSHPASHTHSSATRRTGTHRYMSASEAPCDQPFTHQQSINKSLSLPWMPAFNLLPASCTTRHPSAGQSSATGVSPYRHPSSLANLVC